jgi:hypothetical protein
MEAPTNQQHSCTQYALTQCECECTACTKNWVWTALGNVPESQACYSKSRILSVSSQETVSLGVFVHHGGSAVLHLHLTHVCMAVHKQTTSLSKHILQMALQLHC